jgi:hypothetical protein
MLGTFGDIGTIGYTGTKKSNKKPVGEENFILKSDVIQEIQL